MGKGKLLAIRRSSENVHLESVAHDRDVGEITETYKLSGLFNLSPEWDLFVSSITVLNLSHCELTEIPKSFKLLKLKSLNLSHNKLTNPPQCLYGNGLNTLESLDLSFNELVQFEIEPDCAKTLKRLILSSNSLNNIPPWFLTFQCHHLEEIDYSDNKAEHYSFLKHSCRSNFATMKLNKLILVSACLINADIDWIGCIRSIKYLDISNDGSQSRKHINRLPKIDTLFIKPKWHAIEVLKLNNLNIQLFPENITWLTTLKELHLSRNQIMWISDVMEYLVNLEVLDVSFNDLVMLPKFPESLKVVIASNNHLDSFPRISENVEVLDLYNNWIRSVDQISGDLLIDLDLNYLNEKDFPDYEVYCQNRDKLRVKFDAKDRLISRRLDEIVTDNRLQSESSETSSFDHESTDIIVNERTETYLEEDWDREYETIPKNPDISPSDDEFQGEEIIRPKKRKGPSWDMIDFDEDWIFVDAD